MLTLAFVRRYQRVMEFRPLLECANASQSLKLVGAAQDHHPTKKGQGPIKFTQKQLEHVWRSTRQVSASGRRLNA